MESKPSPEAKQSPREEPNIGPCSGTKEPRKIKIHPARWTCDPKELDWDGWVMDDWLQQITGDDDFFDEDENIRPGKRPVTRNIACIPNTGTILFETGGAFYIGGHISFVFKRIIWPTTENEILIDLNSDWCGEFKYEIIDSEDTESEHDLFTG